MDLETENRLAALLMEEARRLRLQADKEGVHAYLRDPKVRGRPNSRFLTATVLGVQQANRAADVSEMWRAREKELELDTKQKESTRYKSIQKHYANSLHVNSSSRHEKVWKNSVISCSSSKHVCTDSLPNNDSGLRDDEVEKFLHSRTKRGRGTIGSRVDETGPYHPLTSSGHDEKLLADVDVRVKEDWERRVLGPERPAFLKSKEWHEDGHGSVVRDVDASSSKKHSPMEKPKEDKPRKKQRKEQKSKHHHSSRRRE